MYAFNCIFLAYLKQNILFYIDFIPIGAKLFRSLIRGRISLSTEYWAANIWSASSKIWATRSEIWAACFYYLLLKISHYSYSLLKIELALWMKITNSDSYEKGAGNAFADGGKSNYLDIVHFPHFLIKAFYQRTLNAKK